MPRASEEEDDEQEDTRGSSGRDQTLIGMMAETFCFIYRRMVIKKGVLCQSIDVTAAAAIAKEFHGKENQRELKLNKERN